MIPIRRPIGILFVAVLGPTAGCTGVRLGQELGPGVTTSDRCEVEIRNGGRFPMEVFYAVVANDRRSDRRRIGTLQPERSRTVTADCGSMVEAWGEGNGQAAQGAAVASDRDVVIVLR